MEKSIRSEGAGFAKTTVFVRILDITVKNAMFHYVKRPALVITTQKNILQSKFVNSVRVAWFLVFLVVL